MVSHGVHWGLAEPRGAKNSDGLSERDLWPPLTDSLDFSTTSWLKAAHISALLNFGSHQIQPLYAQTVEMSPADFQAPVLISYSVVAGSSHFILSGCEFQMDFENNRWCCTQVTAPVSTALLTCFIIYPSCCANLQEVLLGFCRSWHHESPKLDQMKVGSTETAAYYGKEFLRRSEYVITTHFKVKIQQWVLSFWWWCNIFKAKVIIDFEAMTTDACALTDWKAMSWNTGFKTSGKQTAYSSLQKCRPSLEI